jgi:hypothetical protein
MTPEDLLLSESITEDEYKTLSPNERGVWWSRPNRKHAVRALHFMRIRVASIVSAGLYVAYFHRDIGEANILLLVIACYEFAYYKVRKEKTELDYQLARECYVGRVAEVISKGSAWQQ